MTRAWQIIGLCLSVLWVSLSIAGCGRPRVTVILVQPSAVTMTVGQTVQLRALGLDQKGKPLRDVVFAWTVDGPIGRIDPQGLFVALKPGTAVVTAAVGAVTGTAVFTIEREHVARFALQGLPPELLIGQSATFAVVAQNAAGEGIADIPLEAQTLTAGTRITPPTASTNASGQATFTLTAAPQIGVNQVTFRTENQQTTVTVQGIVGPPAVLQVAPVTTTVRVSEEVRLQLRVYDASGNPIPDQQVSMTALSAGMVPMSATVSTDSQGTASTVVRTSPQAGMNRLQVVLEPLPAQEIAIQGLPGEPAHMTAEVDRSDTVAGSTVTATVRVHDTEGNAVVNTPVQLAATPSDAMLEAITLQTDANGIARVRLQTSQQAGPNTIQATVATLPPELLTITGHTPTSLRVTPSTATLDLGASQRFQAIATAANEQTAEVQPTWKNLEAKGTLAADGTFTATQLGSDTLLATYGELTAGAQLTIVPGVVAQLQVTPTEATLVSGTTQVFQVASVNVYGQPVASTPLWEVANQIGSIDASGLFTATQAGTGEVVVQVDNLVSRMPVTVTPGPLASITPEQERLVVEAGTTVQLSVSGQDAAGNPVAIEPTWQLRDNLGDLSSTGQFQARVTGTGVIRVAAGEPPVSVELPVEVRPGALDRLELTPPALTMRAGEEFTFTATGYDRLGNAFQVEPTWEFSADLGHLSATGTLTARHVGAALVQATVGPLSVQASVVIRPGPLATLLLDPGEPLTVSAGTSIPITVTGHDAYGNPLEVTPTWTQTPPSGLLTAAGVFHAKQAGTTTLVAQSEEQQATLQVTITPGELARLSVAPATISMPAGTVQRFQAVGLDAYDNVLPIQPLWQVPDDLGEIDAEGRFTALRARPGHVVASVEDIMGSAQVTVEPGPLTLLKVTPDEIRLTAGDSLDIQVVGYDALGNPVPIQPSWRISEGLGSMTASGRLTAQRAGTGQIIVTVGTLAAVVPLQVERGAIATLRLDPPSLRIGSGQQQQFTVQGTDRGGNPVPIDTAVWSLEGNMGSIDSRGLFIATVAEAGRVMVRVEQLQATAEVQVAPGAVTSLRLTPPHASLAAGETLPLQPEAFDAAGNRTQLQPTWTVTEDLGIVSSDYIFQARRAGVGKITLAQGELQQTTDIEIKAGPLATIAVTPSELTLVAGNKANFTATGYDAYGNVVAIEPTWTLQGTIGQIDPATGVFQATTAGSGNVIAVLGTLAGMATVRVDPATASRLHLTPSLVTLTAGEQTTFTVSAFDAYQNRLQAEVTWSMTEERGVLEHGTFYARRCGPTAIVARLDDLQAQAIVQVQPAEPIRLQVAPDWFEFPAGKTRQLRVFAHDAHDNVTAVTGTWELQGDIGQITPSGRFTAGKQGTGEVSVRRHNLVASATITVVPGPLQQLRITPAQAQVASTHFQDFTALGLDAGGNTRTVPVRWAVTQGIGQIDASGRFTATQLGQGSVIAYAQALFGTAQVQVTSGAAAMLFVTPAHKTLRAGSTVPFQVRGTDAQGNVVAAPPVQWSVAGDIGSVDASSGLFTARAMGWGKVQATIGTLMGSADIEVLPALPDAERSRLLTSQTTLLADGKTTARIIVLVRDEFGNPVADAQVTLLSSRNDHVDQPALSNQYGVAIGHIRSTTAGVSEITAVVESVALNHAVRLTFNQPGISG